MHPKRRRLEGRHFKRLLIFKANKDFLENFETTFGSFYEDFILLYLLKSFIDLSPHTKNVMFRRSWHVLRCSAAFVDALRKMIKCGEIVRKIQELVNQNGIFLINSTNKLHRSRVSTNMLHRS